VPYAIDTYSPQFPTFPEPDNENLAPGGTFLEWRVINFENLYSRERIREDSRDWVPVPNQELIDFVGDGGGVLIIVDESHHIGNPTTEQSKQVNRLARKAQLRVFMTGTMFHRKPFFIFGQAKFYDPFIYGTNWGNFKAEIAVMGGASGYEVLRYKNLKRTINKLRPVVHMEKYVPPRHPVTNIIPVTLTGRNREVYMRMERESVADLGDGQRVTADIILTKHLRLQQLAGGWARTEDGYKRVGRCKLDIAKSRIAEYLEQDITKAVIGVRFLTELRDLCEVAKKVGFRPIAFHGGLPKGPKRTARITAFQELDEPCLFITQHRAARESIDLSVASVMMLYSLPEGFLTFDQFIRRIEKYRDKRTLLYDILLAMGTRDEVSWAALQEQQDVARLLVTNPELVERIVAHNVDKKRSQ